MESEIFQKFLQAHGISSGSPHYRKAADAAVVEGSLL
jgi:hypothetical protein